MTTLHHLLTKQTPSSTTSSTNNSPSYLLPTYTQPPSYLATQDYLQTLSSPPSKDLKHTHRTKSLVTLNESNPFSSTTRYLTSQHLKSNSQPTLPSFPNPTALTA
eukprot:GHVP01008958.1.p2 GENE.GHVP01008958.1~~GHVP01008958.1.p2  ORF type:complete len:105 (-),score=6.03 GHVP01008958.1:616-930(-)